MRIAKKKNNDTTAKVFCLQSGDSPFFLIAVISFSFSQDWAAYGTARKLTTKKTDCRGRIKYIPGFSFCTPGRDTPGVADRIVPAIILIWRCSGSSRRSRHARAGIILYYPLFLHGGRALRAGSARIAPRWRPALPLVQHQDSPRRRVEMARRLPQGGKGDDREIRRPGPHHPGLSHLGEGRGLGGNNSEKRSHRAQLPGPAHGHARAGGCLRGA